MRDSGCSVSCEREAVLLSVAVGCCGVHRIEDTGELDVLIPREVLIPRHSAAAVIFAA